MRTPTVYVELLDEGVDVWRPVQAEELGGARFRLLPIEGCDPELETWAFPPGATVRCEERPLGDGPALAAVEQV